MIRFARQWVVCTKYSPCGMYSASRIANALNICDYIPGAWVVDGNTGIRVYTGMVRE